VERQRKNTIAHKAIESRAVRDAAFLKDRSGKDWGAIKEKKSFQKSRKVGIFTLRRREEGMTDEQRDEGKLRGKWPGAINSQVYDRSKGKTRRAGKETTGKGTLISRAFSQSVGGELSAGVTHVVEVECQAVAIQTGLDKGQKEREKKKGSNDGG